MILSCNSCGKKFVVPDNAITQAGRLVQCSACGNKWKQFPIKEKKEEVKKTTSENKPTSLKTKKPKKPAIPKKQIRTKKRTVKKAREIDLYSPEYLAKKHGIKIGGDDEKVLKSSKVNNKVSFGFYSSLLLFLVLTIFISRALYFSQDFIIELFPVAEFYLNYFFENIRNIFEIWKSLIISY